MGGLHADKDNRSRGKTEDAGWRRCWGVGEMGRTPRVQGTKGLPFDKSWARPPRPGGKAKGKSIDEGSR